MHEGYKRLFCGRDFRLRSRGDRRRPTVRLHLPIVGFERLRARLQLLEWLGHGADRWLSRLDCRLRRRGFRQRREKDGDRIPATSLMG